MFVIVGLGNPGKKYENTRHNAGFIAIDALADKYGIRIAEKKHKALCGSGVIEGQKVLLVKPETYMNLSGESLAEVLNFYIIISVFHIWFVIFSSHLRNCFLGPGHQHSFIHSLP